MSRLSALLGCRSEGLAFLGLTSCCKKRIISLDLFCFNPIRLSRGSLLALDTLQALSLLDMTLIHTGNASLREGFAKVLGKYRVSGGYNLWAELTVDMCLYDN